MSCEFRVDALGPLAVPLVMKNGELFYQRLRDLHALLLSASNRRPGTFLNTPLSNSVIDSPF